MRENAIKTLKEVIRLFPEEYFMKKIFPFITSDLIKNPHYLFRLTGLYFIREISDVVGKNVVDKSLLSSVLSLACIFYFLLLADNVPNVRFNVAKTLELIIPYLNKDLVNNSVFFIFIFQVKNSLTNLCSDPDADVKFFAQRALKCIN